MSPDQPAARTSTGVLLAVVFLAAFLLLGVFALGFVGILYLRSQTSQMQVAVLAQEQALARAQQAALLADEEARTEAVQAQAEAAQESTPRLAAPRSIVFRLDSQGQVHYAGRTLDPASLQLVVQQAQAEGSGRLEVSLEVAGRCPFQHVAAVQTACESAGVEHVRFRLITGEPPTPTSP